MTIYADIGKSLKMQRKGDEAYADFAARVAKKVNALEDDDWKALKEPVQIWSNEVQKAMEAAKKGEAPDLPELDGWPEEAPDHDPETGEVADEPAEEEAADGDGDEETADEPAAEESAGEEEAADESGEEEEVPQRHKPKKPEKTVKTEKTPTKGKDKTVPKEDKKVAKPPTKEKEAKPGKVAKPAKKAAAGRSSNFKPDQTIKILAKENPHREGTGRFKRWSKYKEGMTVAQALKAGFNSANLRYSVEDGHIKIV